MKYRLGVIGISRVAYLLKILQYGKNLAPTWVEGVCSKTLS